MPALPPSTGVASFAFGTVSASTTDTNQMLRKIFKTKTAATGEIQALHTEQDRQNALFGFLTGTDITENIEQDAFRVALGTVKFKRPAAEEADHVLADMEQQTSWARRLTQQVLDLL